jgi:hypothetical protein
MVVVAAVLAGLIFAMVRITGYARSASRYIQRGLKAQGPPVTAANLAERLPGIPIKPGLVLDGEATNNPLTRLLAGLHAGRVQGATIAVFRTREDIGALAPWYSKRLPGWRAEALREGRGRGEHQSQAEGFTLRKGNVALTLLQLPEGQYRDRIIMILTREGPRRSS